jgi:hypothetical protein
MYLNYFQTDQDQYLVSELKFRDGKNFVQLADTEIEFYAVTDTSEIKLGAGRTTENGKVRLDIKGLSFEKDDEGFRHFESRFAGNEGFKKANKSLSIKEIDLTLESETIDSVNTITVNGIERVAGETVPIDGADLKILVKRLYSDLPLVEGSLEEGEFVYEFPKNVPGDAFGDLWVIARITDNDDYGTIETRQKIRWGNPVSYVLEKKPRALWSRAPLWLIGGVWIAFLLVWYHYFLAVSKLFRIKKL